MPLCVAQRMRFTYEEFLRLEDYSNVRHEYLDGWLSCSAAALVLVSQSEQLVEVRTRDANDAWTPSFYREGEIATLSSSDAQLDIRELYERAAEPSI